MLPGILSNAGTAPDELYQVIVGTLQDGLPADVAEATEHLYRIDPNRSRAVCAWANVLLGTNQIDKAEQILNSHIEQYGEEGYVVTNLAKVHAARNENDRAAAILWHALELDPNQKMAAGWFAAQYIFIQACRSDLAELTVWEQSGTSQKQVGTLC